MITDSETIKLLEKEKNRLSEENQKYREKITALKRQIALDAEKEMVNARMEELKDIDFGQLLSAAIEHEKSEADIIKIMTNGIKRVIGDPVEATLYQMTTVDPELLRMIVSNEGIELSDLISQKKVLYCLMDTEIGEGLKNLKSIERYLTLNQGTVLGDTEKYGEGIVSTKKLKQDESVKYFRYADYKPHRFKHVMENDNQTDTTRVSFPIYHVEENRIDKIEYIILIRNKKGIPFSSWQIRAIRGYGNYGTLALSIKQLIKKKGEILEKDKKIEQQDAWIVANINRYLHNIVTPLSTIENIAGYLNEIMDSETDHTMAKKYSVLLTQVNKVKQSLHSIQDTIIVPKYYMQTQNVQACQKNGQLYCFELDNFILDYLDTVDLKESYGGNIQFTLELNAKGVRAFFDKTKMAYILDNAIRNTFQQSEAKGIKNVLFEIRTIHNKCNNTVVLFLKDFAGGLSEEQYECYRNRKKIQTTKKNGSGEGIPTIIDYFKEMGCKNVELLNLASQGVLYTATFPVADD